MVDEEQSRSSSISPAETPDHHSALSRRWKWPLGVALLLPVLWLAASWLVSTPQVDQIPSDVPEIHDDPANVIDMLSGVDVNNATGLARGFDGTLWASFSDSAGLSAIQQGVKGRPGWLVSVDPSGDVTAHGPLAVFPDHRNSMAVNTAGHVWMANSGRFPGLWRYDGAQIQLYPGAEESFGGAVAVAAGLDGSVWAATETQSLLRYIDDEWTRFDLPIPQRNLVVGASRFGGLEALSVAADGSIWVAVDTSFWSNSGRTTQERSPVPFLINYNGQWTFFTRANSPLTGSVLSIDIDEGGTLWALFESETIPRDTSASDWCGSVIIYSSERPERCSGGVASFSGEEWRIVHNSVDLPVTLAIGDTAHTHVLVRGRLSGLVDLVITPTSVVNHTVFGPRNVAEYMVADRNRIWIVGRRGGGQGGGQIYRFDLADTTPRE